MSTAEFEAFAAALAERGAAPAPAAPAFERVTVLGGGPAAAMAGEECAAGVT